MDSQEMKQTSTGDDEDNKQEGQSKNRIVTQINLCDLYKKNKQPPRQTSKQNKNKPPQQQKLKNRNTHSEKKNHLKCDTA